MSMRSVGTCQQERGVVERRERVQVRPELHAIDSMKPVISCPAKCFGR